MLAYLHRDSFYFLNARNNNKISRTVHTTELNNRNGIDPKIVLSKVAEDFSE